MHGPIPLGCHLLHLADRIAVLLDTTRPVLTQSAKILRLVRMGAGDMFDPALVRAFEEAAAREAFWLDMLESDAGDARGALPGVNIVLDREGLNDLAKLFSCFIDFKSPYTALHSSGVAGTVEGLALRAGFSSDQSFLLRIAGFLHDAGKVSIPTAVLEKPGELSEEEFNVVKGHAYYTDKILRALRPLGSVADWASQHHERPDGTGYPYRLGGAELTVESRLIAAADVYMALREDRPYRGAFDAPGAFREMEPMALKGAVDGDAFALLVKEREAVDCHREAALSEARALHRRLEAGLQDRTPPRPLHRVLHAGA
jgi:HD-GYP domain-containing protein (c-di-GMP phosphodiesterase class II)